MQFNAYTVEFLFLFEIIGFAFNVRRQGLKLKLLVSEKVATRNAS